MVNKLSLKREGLRLALLPCALLLAAAAAVRLTLLPAATPEAAAPLPAVSAAEAPGFTVTEHNGCIAVFAQDSADPFMVTDIPVSGLRKADRSLLAEGIQVSDSEELLKLLEDFGS